MSSTELRNSLHQKLIESGEKDRLKELLRARLIQSGWRDELKLKAQTLVKEQGLNNVKLEGLVTDLTSHGRASVPDAVKKELLTSIKSYLQQHC